VRGRGKDSRPVNVIAAVLKCVPCANDIIDFQKKFIENGCDITVIFSEHRGDADATLKIQTFQSFYTMLSQLTTYQRTLALFALKNIFVFNTLPPTGGEVSSELSFHFTAQ
jgi:hypothetical protein